MSFLDSDREVREPAFSFDPGPISRSAGPLTRMRRALAGPRAVAVGSAHFNPDLNVQLAGPITRVRRTGSDLDLDLTGLAQRTAPVAVTVLGVVVASSLMAKPRAQQKAREAAPSGALAPVERQVEAAAPTLPLATVEATLVGSEAMVPENAPPVLKQVVAAANRIEGLPYSYGGGHGSFESAGYDCSGAVSYALHGGDLLDSPLASGSLASWGEPGPGKAITVYANGGHAFAVVAGLRWDTSGTGSSRPSWHGDMRSTAGFVARHPAGY